MSDNNEMRAAYAAELASKHGLPEGWEARICGDTPAEMRLSAADLAIMASAQKSVAERETSAFYDKIRADIRAEQAAKAGLSGASLEERLRGARN